MGKDVAHPSDPQTMRRLLFRLLATAHPATDHVQDAELLRRFVASNDPAALELLVRRHADAVWCACRRLLRSDVDAEDAFQATFLALIRKARSIRTNSVGGWLYRVAVNAALKLRERASRTVLVDPSQLTEVPAPVFYEPDADLMAAAHEELARLPERERLPVVLCDLEGLSHADAAVALGWPVGTVSGRLSRARAKLRDRLTRRGLTPSAGLLPMLAAPPRLISTAVSLTAGAPPAVVSLTEGVLVMMAQTTWKWVAVTAVCASALGAGGVLALAPGSGGQPPGERAPAPRNPGTPVPEPEPAPPEKGKSAEDDWLPGLDAKRHMFPPGMANFKALPTAFPELEIPQRVPDDQNYRELFAKLCPRLTGKTGLVIEPTDDPLRKLLKARLNEGVTYIQRIRERIRIGAFSPDVRLEYFECLADSQATVTELWSNQPKELIPWLEELVIVAKEFERFTYLRMSIGTDPPHAFDAARLHRFKAEATLWKAKKKQ